MTAPEQVETAADAAAPDPLHAARQVLESLDALPLERHPALFARFDELLREALESPSQSLAR